MEQNNTFQYRALTGLAVCAMVYLFFHQAQLILKPMPIAFKSTDVAFGYNLDTFSGTVYRDKGVTAIGAGTGVALHINGVSSSTTTTNSSGVFTFTNVEVVNQDVVTIFVNGATFDGVRVIKFDAESLTDDSVTDMDLFKDHLILGALINTNSTSADNVTTQDLNIADDASDPEVSAIYSLVNSNRDLQMSNGKELLVHSVATHTASGHIYTHDMDIQGTLNAGTGTVFASGSVIAAGTLSGLTALSLTAKNSGEFLEIAGAIPGNVYIDSGLEAYYRFDEGAGLNASGSMLVTSSGGSLTNGPLWVQTNTGTTSFYNPFAIEFDGTDDYIEFNSENNIDLESFTTFAAWVRRKSTGTTDVILGNTTSSGTALSGRGGYSVWINPSDSKINVSLFDTGGSVTTVASTSTITDQNWHHVAVSVDTSTSGSPKVGIFLDGAMDAYPTGSLMTTDGFTSTKPLTVGALASSGTGLFHGTIDEVRIYNRVLSGGELSLIATGNKSTGSGTYYLSGAINIDGDLGIYGGTLDIGSGYSLSVAGDMNIFGKLRTNSGSVNLDGTAQTLRGSTAFNQLAKSVTASTTLTFESNTEQTVSGAITLNGATNQRLNIRASVAADQAFLIVEDSGATVLNNLDVKDNNALSGALMSCTSGCVDSGNNINWEFLGECGDGVTNTGEFCDDGNTNNLDACPNDCQNSVCGDSVVEGLEDCDPPNTGQCLSNCQFRGTDGGNTGNRSSASSAGSFFKRPEPPDGCGNGILEKEKNEECDAGTRFNGLGTCSFACKLLSCGDGTISPENGEDCEPTVAGTSNGVTTFEVATCGETCTAPITTAEGTKWGGCKRMFLPPCGGSSSSVSTSTKVSRCGNGAVDPGEECDFGGICEGGDFNGSFWTDRASVTTCEGGGGTPEPKGGDGCSALCKTEFCGDGVVQERGADNQPKTADDEQCDNGSVCSNDANASCRLDSDCGTGNSCDFHAAKDRTCSSACKKSGSSTTKPKPSAPSAPTAPSARCGNSRVEATEECDLGSDNGKAGSTCTSACVTRVIDRPTQSTEEICGNAVLNRGEECDNGDDNSDITANACRENCVKPTCGDFVIDTNEQCDNGDGNSSFYADSCRLDCTLPRCGDGIIDSDEECDGSLSCNPNCTLSLRPSRCGNGKVEIGEQCDGGNTENGDGCSAECTIIELAIRKAAATELKIDADVVVVNPTEIATALKFITGNNPCSTLVIKGQNQKAALIRAAALEQKIPIVQNIDLAREIYQSIRPGEIIDGTLCTEINKLKPGANDNKPSAPVPFPELPKLPQAPTQFAYGYYPYAQVTPLISQQGPVGDTGPATAAVAVSGIAAGWSWIRRKRI